MIGPGHRSYPRKEPAERATVVESGFVNQLKTLPVRLQPDG